MSGSWPISWWEFTGEYGPERNGIASPVMRNNKTGERSETLPIGACFDANRDAQTGEKTSTYQGGSDGCSIVCITPRTEPPNPSDVGWWFIDSRANNCTKRGDHHPMKHRCWVRHGTVGDPLTVDKNGDTCAAGAGSIQCASWHGFLQNGVLHS